MDGTWAIPIATLIIVLATFLRGWYTDRKKAEDEEEINYLESIEARLKMAEEGLERCRESEKELRALCEQLEQRNIRLMKMLVVRPDKDLP